MTDTYEQDGWMSATLYQTAKREMRGVVVQECADSPIRAAWAVFHLMHTADGAEMVEKFILDLERETDRRTFNAPPPSPMRQLANDRFALASAAWGK